MTTTLADYEVTRTGPGKETISQWSAKYNNLIEALGAEGVYVADYSESDHSVTGSGNTIYAILDGLANDDDPCAILLPHNEGTTNTDYHFTNTSDLSAYTGVTYVIYPGARIDIATTKTVTLAGHIDAGPYEIFNLNGTASVVGEIKNEYGYAEWFGAEIEDNTVDCGVAINNALALAQHVRLLPYDYYCDTSILLDGDLILEGSGAKVTRIRPGTSFVQDAFLIIFGDSSTATGSILRNILLYDERGDTRSAIKLKDCDGVNRIEQVTITGFDGYGIKGEVCFDLWMANVSITNCGSSTDSYEAVLIGHEAAETNYDPSNSEKEWQNYVCNSWKVMNFKVSACYYTPLKIDHGSYNNDFTNVKIHPRYEVGGVATFPNANCVEIQGHMNRFTNLMIATGTKTAIKITRNNSGITAVDDRTRNFLSGAYNYFENVNITGSDIVTTGDASAVSGAVMTDDDRSNPFVTDRHIGRLLVVTSGTAKGNTYTIDDNDTTTITCTGDDLSGDGFAASDTYAIIRAGSLGPGLDQYIYIEGGNAENRHALSNVFCNMTINPNQANMPLVIQSGANGWIDIGGTNGRCLGTVFDNCNIRTSLDPQDSTKPVFYISSNQVVISNSEIYGDASYLIQSTGNYVQIMNNYFYAGSSPGNIINYVRSTGEDCRLAFNQYALVSGISEHDHERVTGARAWDAFGRVDDKGPGGLYTYKIEYDFAIHGGATGTIALGNALPNDVIVMRAWYNVLTAFTSGGSATVQIGHPDDTNGIQADLAFDNAVYSAGLHDGIPDGTSANAMTQTTATGREIGLLVSTAALTAGKMEIWVQFIITE